MKIVTV